MIARALEEQLYCFVSDLHQFRVRARPITARAPTDTQILQPVAIRGGESIGQDQVQVAELEFDLPLAHGFGPGAIIGLTSSVKFGETPGSV